MQKRNLKNIPTSRIKEILSENYTRGVNGAEYEEVKDELERILWEREDRLAEAELERQIAEMDEAA